MEIKLDQQLFDQFVSEIPRTMTIAASRAIDLTISRSKDALMHHMIRRFKSATPYTLGSVKMETTQKRNMEGRIYIARPHTPREMTHSYLKPLVDGGDRRMKGYELALQAKYGTKHFMPGENVPRDQYGNITAGKIRQMLSSLKAGNSEESKRQNETDRSKKRNPHRGGYFYRPGENGKSGAVFERLGKGKNRRLRLFLSEAERSPRYKEQFPFYAIVQQTADQWFAKYFEQEFIKDVANKGWRK